MALFLASLLAVSGFVVIHLLSAAGDLAVAVIFLRILPELGDSQQVFEAAQGTPSSLLGNHVYLIALVSLVLYAAARAALRCLTRSAALEGKARGLRVNAVLPGAIETLMLRENPNVKSGVEGLDPNSVGQPKALAAAIALRASDDARFVQGAALVVDGWTDRNVGFIHSTSPRSRSTGPGAMFASPKTCPVAAFGSNNVMSYGATSLILAGDCDSPPPVRVHQKHTWPACDPLAGRASAHPFAPGHAAAGRDPAVADSGAAARVAAGAV